jgi:FixJ family two-component response regulator
MVTRAERSRTAPPAGAGQVFLVDDESSVRRSFTRLLRTAGFAVSSFGTAEEFLADAANETRGCVVADLRLPGLSGLELQDRVAERGLDLPIVFISGRADVGSGIQAMKGGAVDFLEKPVSDRDLIDAIRRALAEGERRRAQREERELLGARLSRLTPREREVCSLIVLGLLNKQVGAELGASEKTIKVHRARVMEKMEAGSLAELVRMSDKAGLRARLPRRGPLRTAQHTEVV